MDLQGIACELLEHTYSLASVLLSYGLYSSLLFDEYFVWVITPHPTELKHTNYWIAGYWFLVLEVMAPQEWCSSETFYVLSCAVGDFVVPALVEKSVDDLDNALPKTLILDLLHRVDAILFSGFLQSTGKLIESFLPFACCLSLAG